MVGRSSAISGRGRAHAGADAITPIAGYRRAAWALLGLNTQGTLDHFQPRPIVAADTIQPVLVAQAIVDALEAARDAAGQCQADLRAESRRQVQRIVHRITPTPAQVQHAQLRIHLLEVGHWRHDAMLQDLDRDDVLYTNAHGVAGEALGVGNHDVVGSLAKGVTQGHYLGRGAAAAGGREGLVGHEDGLGGYGVAVQPEAAFGRCDQVLHHQADMVYVQTRAMVGAVACLAAKYLDNAAHASLAHGVFAFHHQGTGPHAQDRAVTAAVKGQRGLVHPIVRGGCTQGQEAGTHPFHQAVAGDVVTAQYQDPAAAAGADPILGQRHSLGRAGTGGVDVGVGPTGADVLGELAVAHSQNAEDEAAVELIGLALELLPHLADAAVDLLQRGRVTSIAAQVLQQGQLAEAVLPGVVAGELLSKAVAARKRAGEDHSSLVAQGLWQQPAVGEILAGAGLAPGLYQRDARLSQGVEPGGEAILGRDVQRLHQLLRHSILRRQVELASTAGQLDYFLWVLDYLEAAAAVLGLDQPRDALVEDALAEPLRDQVDELLAAQDAQGVVRVHHRLVGPRQAQPGAGDHHRAQGSVVAVEGPRLAGRAGRHLLQDQGQGLAQRVGAWHGAFLGNGGRGRDRRWLLATDLHRRLLAHGMAGGIQAAQRLIERWQFTLLGVVSEQRDHIWPGSQHVVGETLERLLGAYLDEGTAALTVEGLQALHPLHGRGDLQLQDVFDSLDGAGIQLAGDVSHQGEPGLADA